MTIRAKNELGRLSVAVIIPSPVGRGWNEVPGEGILHVEIVCMRGNCAGDVSQSCLKYYFFLKLL